MPNHVYIIINYVCFAKSLICSKRYFYLYKVNGLTEGVK